MTGFFNTKDNKNGSKDNKNGFKHNEIVPKKDKKNSDSLQE